jgi:hypothetical protein
MGFTSPAFLPDVISALQIALAQAEGQLGGGLDEIDVVLDIGAPATKIDGDIPVIKAGNNNPHGKHFVMSAVISEISSVPVVAEIDIVLKKHVALVRAVNDDDISRR